MKIGNTALIVFLVFYFLAYLAIPLCGLVAAISALVAGIALYLGK